MASISDKVAQIRQAVYGKDVRESIASGIEAINSEVETTTAKQAQLETTFEQLIINAGNSNAEIVDARGGFDTLRKKLDSYVINVKDFGAKGDGITDDTTAIQNAINSLNAGCTLFIPTGVYLVNDIITVNKQNIKITGNKAILKANSNKNVLFQIVGQNISIDGMIFDGSNNVYVGIAVLANSKFITIRNAEIKNIYSTMYNTNIPTAGIRIYGNCSNITITDCYIHDVTAEPNSIVGDVAGTSRGILILPNTTAGEDVTTNVIISGCVIENIYTSEDADGIGVLNSILNKNVNVIIASNKFRNCAKRAVKIMAPGVIVKDNIIYNDFSGQAADWSDGMYSAISVYDSNTIVEGNYIYGGSYYKPIDIGIDTKPIANIIVKNNKIEIANGYVLPYQGSISLLSDVDSVSIVGNILTRNRIGIYARGKATNVDISGNIIRNCSESGILFDNYTYVLFDRVNISNNIIEATQFGVSVKAGQNIVIASNNINAGYEGVRTWEGVTEAIKGMNLGNRSTGLYVHRVSSLPPASAYYEGNIIRYRPNDSTTDKLYVCIRMSDGTYQWKEIVL